MQRRCSVFTRSKASRDELHARVARVAQRKESRRSIGEPQRLTRAFHDFVQTLMMTRKFRGARAIRRTTSWRVIRFRDALPRGRCSFRQPSKGERVGMNDRTPVRPAVEFREPPMRERARG